MSGGCYEQLLCSPHSNQAGCLPLRAFPTRPFHGQSTRFDAPGRGEQITFAWREKADDRFDCVLYSCRSTASGRWPRIR